MSAKPQICQRGCGREAVELLYNLSTANPRKPPAFPKRRPAGGEQRRVMPGHVRVRGCSTPLGPNCGDVLFRGFACGSPAAIE